MLFPTIFRGLYNKVVFTWKDCRNGSTQQVNEKGPILDGKRRASRLWPQDLQEGTFTSARSNTLCYMVANQYPGGENRI